MTTGSTGRAGDSAGFTLLELVVVMAIAGVLATMSLFGFSNWRNTSEQQGSAQQIVSQLRNAAEQAISEGRTQCVDLDSPSRTYSVWRYACSSVTGTQISGSYRTQSSRVTFTSSLIVPSPAPACPSGHACVYFYPRGTAVQGTVTVASSTRAKTYVIHVEGLTARVYM